MDWFLYDNGLRLERVNGKHDFLCSYVSLLPTLASSAQYSFIFFVITFTCWEG